MKTTFNQRVFRGYGDQSHHFPLWGRSSTKRGNGSPSAIHLVSGMTLDCSPPLQTLNLVLFSLYHPSGFLTSVQCSQLTALQEKGNVKEEGKGAPLLWWILNRRLNR